MRFRIVFNFLNNLFCRVFESLTLLNVYDVIKHLFVNCPQKPYLKASMFVHLFRYYKAFFLLTCVLFTVTACDYTQNQLKTDRAADLQVQDFKDALAPRSSETGEPYPAGSRAVSGASIPPLQPYVSNDIGAMGASMPLVSVSVNQSVPLRDVLFELAKQADYDLILDPRIRGSIIYRTTNKPFDEVIKSISNIAGLRYKFEGQSVRVELDTPYNETYRIEYLNLVRSNSSSIRNDINVVSGDGADTGSSYQSSFESENDFWTELETNLKQILANANNSILTTDSDPYIVPVAQPAPVVPLSPDGGSVPTDAILRIESLPVNSSGAGKGYQPVAGTYAINKQAGMIQVHANQDGQNQVKKYLEMVRKSVTSQVLIEAKILEVQLNDQFSTGIDWSAVTGEFTLGYTSAGVGSVAGLLNGAAGLPGVNGQVGNSAGFIGYAGNSVQSIVNAVSEFGTVRALASPRLTVLNNQSAILNVATNRVFFEIDVESTATDGGGSQVNVDSELRNVPEGILVNVQPSINHENGTISMALRPTITRVANTVNDPGIAFAAANNNLAISSAIPELNVQEIDSIIQVRSGQAVVMGGLLQDRVDTSEDGIPGLMEVPVVGSLFKQKADNISKTELVILLKATILEDPSDSISNTDRDVYRQFSGDRRPFDL